MKKLTVMLAFFLGVAVSTVNAQQRVRKSGSETETLHAKLEADLVMMYRLTSEEAQKVIKFEASHQKVRDGLKPTDPKKKDAKYFESLKALEEKEKAALKAIIPEEKVYYIVRFFSTNKAYIDTKGTL